MRQALRFLASRLMVAAALLVLLPGLVHDALAQAGARVAGIEFRGNKALDSEVLRQSLRTKVGQPLDESLLNEDVKTLYDLFSSVEVEKTQEADQVRILFIVTENAIASEVIIKGTSGLSEKDVRAVIDTAKGRPVAEFRIENDAKKIERLYRLKGYRFVEVQHDVADSPNGKIVTFTVLEGPKVQVDTITFKGNDHIQRGKLLDSTVMATQETGFLGLFGADYVEETLLKDRNSLLRLYRYEGYLDAQVRIAKVDYSEDRRKAFITIEITEGPGFVVGKVDLVGVAGFPGGAEALRPLLRLQPGKRYRLEDVSKTLNAVEAAYHDEGYYSVDIDFEEKPANGVVDLTLKIDEQSKVRVRDVLIVGNSITQDKVIRREARGLLPGQVLNQNEVRKTENRLKGLGYFTQVEVEVVKPKLGDDPDQRDVRIAVDDSAKTGSVRIAVGASSDMGLLGNFTLTKRNFDWRDWPEHFADALTGRAFTGAGQTFQLELAPGTDFSAYRLAFTEPWMFDKPVEFGWDLLFTKFTRFDYDVDRRALDVTFGRRFTFEGRDQDTTFGVSGTTRIESYELSNLSESTASTAFLAQGTNSLVSERFRFRIDRVDNAMDPQKGWFAQYVPEIGFGGDVRLFKQDVEARRYWTLWKTEDERAHTLALGGQFGYAKPMGSSVKADPNVLHEEYTPIYEGYFAGGASSIRGFSFGGAGPHGHGNPFIARQPGETQAQSDLRLGTTESSILNNDGDPLGGSVLFLANAEYGFPVYEDMLRGVVFIDTGVVRDSFDSSHGLDKGEFDTLKTRLLNSTSKQANQIGREMQFDDGGSFFQDIRVSIGFGFRIKIAALGSAPIALDFGFPIKKRDGDDTQVLSFSIEQKF